MTNEQETVADIIAEMRKGVKDWKGETLPIYDDLADRIEAAHKRETANLRETLETITGEMCLMCRKAHPGEYCVNGCEYLRISKEARNDER